MQVKLSNERPRERARRYQYTAAAWLIIHPLRALTARWLREWHHEFELAQNLEDDRARAKRQKRKRPADRPQLRADYLAYWTQRAADAAGEALR